MRLSARSMRARGAAPLTFITKSVNNLPMATPATLPAFKPVPRTTLRGFTPDRQRRFIAALAATGSVMSAAAEVNMSRGAAYLLRTAPGAEEFAAAWDAAIDQGIRALKSVAFDRAIHGEPTTIFRDGVPVGEARVHSTQLLMRLLTHYDPQRGSPASDSIPAAVAARLAAEARPMARRTPAEAQLACQWGQFLTYQRAAAGLALATRIRRWLAEGPGALETHLRHLETTARNNPMVAAELEDPARAARAEAAHAAVADISERLTAELVEAFHTAGLIPHIDLTD